MSFCSNDAGVVSFAAGTTQQLLFPLVYADTSQGDFEETLTAAHFYVGKTPTSPPADIVISLALGSGITEEEIEGVRHLVVSLAPSRTSNLSAASYVYATTIEWGASNRAVIASDLFVIEPWPGRSS